jgi:hypothetical protein
VFEGNRYFGRAAVVEPVPGDPVGVAVVPACPDAGDVESSSQERIEVASIAEIDPAIAVVAADDPGTIFIRDGLDRLPGELGVYFEAPTCDPTDIPIQLDGRWLGILSPDGSTEIDMDPPYEVELLVERSTAQRYERAQLTVLVLASLGRPLTREDVRMSLQQGGGISVLASCDGERSIAEHVEATPPGEEAT